jgi:hypothetical protein
MRGVAHVVIAALAWSASDAHAQPGAPQPAPTPTPSPAPPPPTEPSAYPPPVSTYPPGTYPPPASARPPQADYEVVPPPQPRQIVMYEEKSGGVALGLSVGFTAGGLVLLASGNEIMALAGFGAFVVGPSTGHWYAHEAWNPGMGVRLAGVGMFIIGLTQVDLSFGFGHETDDEEEDETVGTALIIGGMAAYVVGGLYEIISAPRAAERYNEDRRNLNLGVTLVGRDQTPGLALIGTF